ncbi:MAG: class I SAM-dependent methyltransferase [Sphingomonadales bacterium]|nr:class I SAM-dependent methyltransferase [Sphingomonadales bacterium]
MNPDFTAFRDPASGAILAHEGDALVAPDGTRHPIVSGIPRFVPPGNYADDFGAQWNRFPQTQLDSHTGLTLTRDRLARCLRGELDSLGGKRVLEAGSGAGRFTEVLLAAGAEVHSFDYSSAVAANAANNGASDHLTLAQGDIRCPPFAEASYDHVICLGVLQHTPSPEDSIAALWRMVRPGGRLVIDHYRFRWRFLLPTPVGDAASLYRWFILRMAPEKRAGVVERITDFWFPWHWRFRDSYLLQRVVRRLSPVRFYYPDMALKDRDMHYRWSQLDTHDSTTDVFKHLRRPEQIRATLEGLGARDIHVWIGGNGVEAWGVKPA